MYGASRKRPDVSLCHDSSRTRTLQSLDTREEGRAQSSAESRLQLHQRPQRQGTINMRDYEYSKNRLKSDLHLDTRIINQVLDLLEQEKDKVINCPINFSEQDRFWNKARLKQIEIIENRVKELQGNNHG